MSCLVSESNGYSFLYLMLKMIQTRNNMNITVCVFSTVTARGCVLTLFMGLFYSLWSEQTIIYRLVRQIFHILYTGSVCLYFLNVYFHVHMCENIRLMWKWCSVIAECGSRLTVDLTPGGIPSVGLTNFTMSVALTTHSFWSGVPTRPHLPLPISI